MGYLQPDKQDPFRNRRIISYTLILFTIIMHSLEFYGIWIGKITDSELLKEHNDFLPILTGFTITIYFGCATVEEWIRRRWDAENK